MTEPARMAPLGQPNQAEPVHQRVTAEAKSPRSVALMGLFLLAVFYTLQVARPFLLPLVLGLLFSLLLNPLVRGLKRLHIPRAVASGLLVLGLVAAITGAIYYLSTPAANWLEQAPTHLQQVENELKDIFSGVGTMSKATEQMERMTEVGANGTERPTKVQVQEASLQERLLQGTMTTLTTLGLTLILTYFLLATGELSLRKLVHALPTLEDKKRLVEIASHLQVDLSAYLLTVSAINVALGLATWLVMWLLGMPNPALWGVMATLLNYVPYIGAIVGIGILGLVSILTFDGFWATVMPPLAYFLLTALEGYFLTPTVVGRRLTLNPLVILISLIFWGWLWGIPGALLSIPLVASFKIFCDHIERLKPLGELLGH